jgi:hypothetical protein
MKSTNLEKLFLTTSTAAEQQPQLTRLLMKLRSKPFWIWDEEQHKKEFDRTSRQCCFNDIIPAGRPIKNNVRHGLYDEKELCDALTDNNLVYCLKSTGLGISECCLRFLSFLCVTKGHNEWKNAEAIILVGPSQLLATTMIRRLKRLWEPVVYFSERETLLTLNSVRIQAEPSNNLNASRSLENPKFIMVDEMSFFRNLEQSMIRQIVERYLAKSSPMICLISTPGDPDSTFAQIDTEEPSIYTKLRFPYTRGLGKIYSKEEVELAKSSRRFESEYNLKFGGALEGNVVHESDILNATSMKYDSLYVNPTSLRCCGIDPGFGSSAFSICIGQWNSDRIEILYCDEFERIDFRDALAKINELYRKYQPMKIWLDGSASDVTRSLKADLGDVVGYERIIAEAHRDKVDPENRLGHVIPVNFSARHKELLIHAKIVMQSKQIAIDKRFDKLISSLRTARERDNSLLKQETQYDDIMDAFRLMCQGYRYD